MENWNYNDVKPWKAVDGVNEEPGMPDEWLDVQPALAKLNPKIQTPTGYGVNIVETTGPYIRNKFLKTTTTETQSVSAHAKRSAFFFFFFQNKGQKLIFKH